MTAKKRIVLIVLSVCIVTLAVAAVFLGLRYKTMSDTLSQIDYIVINRYEEAPSSDECLAIQPDKWKCSIWETLDYYKYPLNYYSYSAVVMKDGTRCDAVYYRYADVFSITGIDGYYISKETTKFRSY